MTVHSIDAAPSAADGSAWPAWLGPDEAAFERLRRAESIGRPVGDARFVAELEAATGRQLRPAKRGRRPAATPADDDGGQLSALSPEGGLTGGAAADGAIFGGGSITRLTPAINLFGQSTC